MIMIGDSKASEVQLIDDVIYETLGLQSWWASNAGF